ncbi:MAG TPA: hypothetical protein DCG79_04725 [Clostridiales bacterium]|nr:hypothetical protein [Clostridiales bacterium]
MQAFFSGTVVLLYYISHYASEYIFFAACVLPTIYFAAVILLLRFGVCGRMLAASRRAKRFSRKGVLTGEGKSLFYQKCVKGMPASFRASYVLFSEGRTSAAELTEVAACSLKLRGGLLKGGMAGVGALSALAVFLTFYFVVPLGECLLRAALPAFFAAANGVALHFSLYAYLVSAERAAEKFVAVADKLVLREKKERDAVEISFLSPSESREDKDQKALTDLRAFLRDLSASKKLD